MPKVAVIKIDPENLSHAVDVQTNGVSNLDMLEFLNTLTKHFAQEIIKEAQELGCSSEEDFDGYIKFLRNNKL